MKNTFLTLAAIAGLLLASCGGNSNKEEQLDTFETSTYESDYTTDDNEYEEVESIEEFEEEPVVSAPSKSNEDWDAYLKSYEGFIDQYIKLMKKAQSGDMSAMMEYAEYMDKATDLQEKMENAKSDLSAVQMAKFMKLQTKLMNAVSQLQ